MSFSAVSIVHGVNTTHSSLATTTLGFKYAISKSLSGVRVSDITVRSLLYSSLQPQSERYFHRSVDDGSHFLLDLLRAPVLPDGGQQLQTTLSVDSVATISWNVTVPLSRLKGAVASVAYATLTSQLTASMNNGTFVSLLQKNPSALATATTASASVSTYTVTIAFSPTSGPTSAPTKISTISTVSYLSVSSVYSTSFIVTAHLTRTIISIDAITLYCAGFSNGTSPLTIGSIKSASADGTSSVGGSASIPVTLQYPLQMNITLAGLESLRSYAVYCYLESATGEGTPLAAVLSRKVVASTRCCRLVTYSNAPSFVFGSVSKYKGSSSSLYVFTYALSARPSNAVKVTPLLYFSGVPTKDISASPSYVNFSTSSLVTGSFILSANDASINGNLTIVLSITGPSAVQYYNRISTVQVLSSSSPIPSPVMVLCQFSDSGQAVVVSFDTPTDSAGIAAVTWPCSSLFNFVSAPFTTCSWTNASAVTMTFSATTTHVYLIPGNTVTLIADRLKAFCSGSVASCVLNRASPTAFLSTRTANNPSSPVALINCPLLLGSCTNLIIDATSSYGNGGRPYNSVEWAVSAVKNNNLRIDVSNLQAYLTNSSSIYQVSQPITIVPTYLTAGMYSFTLSLTNFFGLKAFTTVTVVVKTDPNLPTLSVLGASYRTTVASSPLTILSVANLSSCAAVGTKVAFVWSVAVGSPPFPTTINSSSLDPLKFSLVAYKLAVDSTYTITVTASTSASSVSVSTTVYVAHGVVTASIVGGSYRSTPVDKTLQLDASNSFDSDYSSRNSSNLLFKVTSLPFEEFVTTYSLMTEPDISAPPIDIITHQIFILSYFMYLLNASNIIILMMASVSVLSLSRRPFVPLFEDELP